MLKKSILSGLLTILSIIAFAQRDQAEYLEARRLYRQEQYREAKLAFTDLSDSEVFGKHSLFYAGLSSFQLGETSIAIDMWRQLLVRYPDWEQKREVLFWLAYANFEEEKYERGLTYASQLTGETLDIQAERDMLEKYLRTLPADSVKRLYSLNSTNKILAGILVRKLNQVPYNERDFLLIDKLISKWDFERNELTAYDLPRVRKKEYEIAIVLPFLFDGLENPGLVMQNALVMDMYQGMLMAAEDLRIQGRPVNLTPYDTRRKEEVTRGIMAEAGMAKTDLIIGPLYAGPNEVVNAFSIENKINTFNPLSSNEEVIGDNPFSFLIRPGYETMALELAKLASEENTNPNVMIFYEDNARDSLFAAVYRNAIEKAGLQVVMFQQMNSENARQALDQLTAQYDVFLTKTEADSILLLPARFVRERRIRYDELSRMKEEEERNKNRPDSLRTKNYFLPISYDPQQNAIVYYEKRHQISPDSIGHVLGATRSNLYANNLISALETRGDSTKLYGYGDWLDFTMLSYGQLERLEVALAHPDFIDKERFSYKDIYERIQEKYKTKPSVNHFRGYEIVWYVGTMLHRHGKYFQLDIRDGEYVPGKIFEGFRYGTRNDNQVVPVVRFKNARLQVVNKANYEDREE